METALLLFLAVIPGVYLLVRVYRLDHREKEPKKLIALLLLLGALSTIPTIIVELIAGEILGAILEEGTYFYLFIENFFAVALVEEIFKYLAMKLPTWKHKAFNYRFDAVVYSISATLGFAVVENVLYCLDGGLSTALMRMILGVPGHVIYAIFMGYYYGLAKKNMTLGWKKKARKYLRRAVWIPVLIHGLDDFCLSCENEYILLVYFGYLVILYIFAFGMERRIAKNDECIAFRLKPLPEDTKVSVTSTGGDYTRSLKDNGYIVPNYNRASMIERTVDNPSWIHFGARSGISMTLINVANHLLNIGAINRGIILAEESGCGVIQNKLRPFENYTFFEKSEDGKTTRYAIGSIAKTCLLDDEASPEFENLKRMFLSDSLQMVTFTLPHMYYDIADAEGNIYPQTETDFLNGPGKTKSMMGMVSSLLYCRYLSSKSTIAMVSCDDIANNADRLTSVILAFAQRWASAGLTDEGFVSYIKNDITFPNTIIDREHNKMVVEENFPNGRPNLERGGIIFR